MRWPQRRRKPQPPKPGTLKPLRKKWRPRRRRSTARRRPRPRRRKRRGTKFKFVLKFPANFKPGEFPGLKISATGKPYGTVQVRTQDTMMTVKVLPPDPKPESKRIGKT